MPGVLKRNGLGPFSPEREEFWRQVDEVLIEADRVLEESRRVIRETEEFLADRV